MMVGKLDLRASWWVDSRVVLKDVKKAVWMAVSKEKNSAVARADQLDLQYSCTKLNALKDKSMIKLMCMSSIYI